MAEVKLTAPNNSFANKNGAPQPTNTKPDIPTMQPVVKGPVKLKEPTKMEKLRTDAKNAGKNVMVNTVWPSIKNMILQAVNGCLSMIFFPDGSKKPVGSSIPSMISYTAYNSFYDKSGQTKPRVINMSEPVFKNPIVCSMDEATDIINAMREVIATYGFARWSTLYELCGMQTTNWQGANKYGWTSVESTMINTVHDANGNVAFELRMPKASPIDDE